jgi:hypothetical protein
MLLKWYQHPIKIEVAYQHLDMAEDVPSGGGLSTVSAAPSGLDDGRIPVTVLTGWLGAGKVRRTALPVLWCLGRNLACC